MHNFELQFWHVGGCASYPPSSKSILKVVSQMVRLCDYATVLFSYLHIGFLTFSALLKNTFGDGTPCIRGENCGDRQGWYLKWKGLSLLLSWDNIVATLAQVTIYFVSCFHKRCLCKQKRHWILQSHLLHQSLYWPLGIF